MNFNEHIKRNKSRYCIALLFITTLCLSTKGITDEGNVSMNGDMPRYMMNGVYFYDLFRDMPLNDPLAHAYKYFARYPALSLGHHPLLLGIAEVPFYFIFGISVFSARLTIVCFSLIAVVSWFFLARSIYDETVAFLSSLLLATTPFVVQMSQIVMPEIPTLSLIILGTYLFCQYTETGRKKYVYLSMIVLSLSVLSKHIAIFMFLVLPVYYFAKKGPGNIFHKIVKDPRKLLKKELIIVYAIIAVLVVPLVPLTVKYSGANLEWIFRKSLSDRLSADNLLYYIRKLYTLYLTPPVLIISVISLYLSAWRRDKRIFLFIFWITICYLFFTFLGTHNSRFAMYWIPPFCLLAASLMNISRRGVWKIPVMTVLILVAGYQFIYAYQREPAYSRGYEDAARYIVENRKGESIMYGGVHDTGYFIFFVRKHDPDRKSIILRADKVYATSFMSRIVDERINKRDEIYRVLNDYGVKYVVIEDTFTHSEVLEWLRSEVKQGKFDLRKKTLLQSNDRRVHNVPVAVYEYRDYTPHKKGIMLNMNIPLMGDTIEVPFEELLK